MLGIIFLWLGLAAATLSVWKSGLLSGFLWTSSPDHVTGALSFTAAIFFFGLWQATKSKNQKVRRTIFTD